MVAVIPIGSRLYVDLCHRKTRLRDSGCRRCKRDSGGAWWFPAAPPIETGLANTHGQEADLDRAGMSFVKPRPRNPELLMCGLQSQQCVLALFIKPPNTRTRSADRAAIGHPVWRKETAHLLHGSCKRAVGIEVTTIGHDEQTMVSVEFSLHFFPRC